MEGIFPPSIYCIACGSVIDKTRHYALCDACIEKFHWVRESTCEKCGKRLNVEYQHTLCYDCRDLIHDFDQGYTCTQYGLYERVVMMDYKYSDKSYIGKILGDILADRMEGEPLNIDLVIPVPIHKSRGKSRGYN
ncbi:MAG: double zinc ribbon domain-containing protein, partial [Anaerovoracaceae bacterium]